MEPLQEVELIDLAKDIVPENYTRLCNALGYSYATGQQILLKRHYNFNEALVEILITWKTDQKETDQLRFILASKLREVGLGDLGDSLCKGSYHLNRRDQRDRHDPETVPLPTWSAGACAYGQSQFDLRDQEMAPRSSDIYAKKISESLTVGKCREKLVNKYMNSYCKIQKAPWDPNDLADLKDLHTVVTMVKKDAHGKDTKTKEILQGSVTKIFSKEVNGVLPRRILISAPAGRGKTTAVAKMAYDWANRVQGSSLENLPLLFLVKLRKTSKQTSIAEAIRSQLLSDVTDLTQDGLHRFINENQGICHILLDGLDEYAGIAANQGLGSNIVDVMLWEEFPDCRVLVTTRPHLENFFNQGELPRVYTKMWIEGFSHDSSREYIDKFFASTSISSTGQNLKDYLDDKPLINELVITPLFCLMVCHLWSKDMLGNETTTQTELLDRVNLCLMHHANARSTSPGKITTEELRKIICKLGKVALAGLLDDAKKLVFSSHDFISVPAVLDKACEIGIISRTAAQVTGFPETHETSFSSIEFYHKLAQEHAAGKRLAAKTNKYLLRLKISKLDKVLQKIKENIGDYENLIRFAAGTENSLCIRIMESILANSRLDESERYRILLDCSSETLDTEGGVSSLVKRCVTAQRMVLKSPTVYTVVGMRNLPEQLKGQIREVKFEDSTPSTDVVSGLWSCMRTFSALRILTISDCSLNFPPTSPELPSVMQLKVKRVTSQSYEGLLSSIPNVNDITVGNAENEDMFQIQSSLRRHLRGQELTLIRLDRPHSLPSEERVSGMSREMRGLGLLTSHSAFGEATLFGVICGPEETVIDLVQRSTRLMSSSRYTEQLCGSLNSDRHACNMFSLTIRDCKLTAEITSSMWSCLRSFPSLGSLIISDSSLSFLPSPPELTSVTELKTERATSQSYEGLLSSIPNVKEIDITVGSAENEDISQIKTSLRRHLRGQELTLIMLDEPHSLPSEESVPSMSKETMRGLGLLTSDSAFCEVTLSGVICGPEETVIDLVQSSTCVMSSILYSKQVSESLNSNRKTINIGSLTMRDCKLNAVVASSMWSCLRSFPSLGSLTISDSSLSFPPSPPELTYVTQLIAKRVTSQSYEGLLSSLPGLKVIDISIDDAERDISQITAGLRQTRRQQLRHIDLQASDSLPPEKKNLSRETMKRLSLLIREQTENLQSLSVSGVKCIDEDYVDLIKCSKMLRTLHFQFLGWGSLDYKENTYGKPTVTLGQCQLSTEMTIRLWTCLRSLSSQSELTISDSSLSFPPSPPELPCTTKLIAKRVTSQSYEGLLTSLPGLEVIDISIDDAEGDISQITTGLCRTGGQQQLTSITIKASDSLPPEKKNLSRETMKGLSLLIREHIKNLQSLSVSGVKCTDEDYVDLIEHVQSSKTLSTLHFQFLGWGSLDYKDYTYRGRWVTLDDCLLSTEMTVMLWTCLRSFPSLSTLTISNSSLSFPPSPPELTSITELEAKGVTQSYEGLLSSLPGLKDIKIIIDDAERDISQITACLRRTRGQQLTSITIKAQDSLPWEKKTLSRETMRGLGRLIREQTKNLRRLWLTDVRCTDEEDWVYLIECCRHVKAMESVHLLQCGTKKGGRLESFLMRLLSSGDTFKVTVYHDDHSGWILFEISRIR